MKVPGGGFDQCYNAQAVVAANMVQASNDNSQLEPMLARHADAGYFSAANVAACDAAGIAALIAMGRQPHHCTPAECFAPAPPAPENPTPVAAEAHWLKTPEGKKLYALCKQTPEPVFGIIKSVLGFRQFLLRGLAQVRGEWSPVTMAWNLKRIFVLSHPG